MSERGFGAMESAGGIEYRLVLRKGMRSIRMRVIEPEGAVIVSAGTGFSRRQIDHHVSSHADWIRERRAAIARKKPRFPVRFEDGAKFSLWDRPKVLRVRKVEGGRASSELVDDELIVTIPVDAEEDEVKRMFMDFMRGELQRALDLVVKRAERATGIRCAGVQIRNMETRWGSCTSSTGRIRVALKLAAYPPECLVMVVVHELTHIRYRAHDKDFYDFLSRHYPRWREVDRLLRE